MRAPEVLPQRCGVLGSNTLPYELPAFVEVLLRASELEVVDVNHEEQLQLLMHVARAPSGYFLESVLGQVVMTVSFPNTPRNQDARTTQG